MAVYTIDSEPVRAGGFTVTPRSLVLAWRGPNFGFAWQMPLSVLVQDGTTERRLPIVDVSFIGYWSLLCLSFVLWRINR